MSVFVKPTHIFERVIDFGGPVAVFRSGIFTAPEKGGPAEIRINDKSIQGEFDRISKSKDFSPEAKEKTLTALRTGAIAMGITLQDGPVQP